MQMANVWQASVAAVNAFPLAPDVIGHVNAMAEEAAEPSAETLRAAAFAATAAGQGDYSTFVTCILSVYCCTGGASWSPRYS